MKRAQLALLSVLIAGCGSATPAAQEGQDAFAIVANADIAVGSGRLLVGIVGPDGERVGSPDHPVAIEVAPANQPEARQRDNGAFMWIVEPAFGLYRATFDFDRAGAWLLTVVPPSGIPLPATSFIVNETSIAPAIGERAPQVETPTVTDAPLDAITTDPNPDPRFYTISLDEAIGSGRSTVAVFSTPAYCNTAACGPMLEQTKQISAIHPDVNYIHIEIYEGWNEADFVPDGDHLAPAVGPSGWNLPTEPWVFVIDENGIITHRFEGVMDPSELTAALG